MMEWAWLEVVVAAWLDFWSKAPSGSDRGLPLLRRYHVLRFSYRDVIQDSHDSVKSSRYPDTVKGLER
ncbi:hypothetical protein HZ326_7055 [Fusarium oxysporum f. sp. albedinis]|nr:hypothetical protein HZ326_7055 [Fusarium oxysporum f. sp. albedinis]